MSDAHVLSFMSLFSKAGKTFERTKRRLVDGESASAAYVCRACEESVTEAYEYCPHCGEAAVEPVDAESNATDG